ncbi:toxin glutamine deamidase domain-containing protein [Kitasatospora sp. NPDC096147]|uniref:toxin glutamine deamidase domain-containing protein n=1 Tax=Kitasatospora sp. NPDC096147 TaxID=3364093 RepID=UPI0038263FC6
MDPRTAFANDPTPGNPTSPSDPSHTTPAGTPRLNTAGLGATATAPAPEHRPTLGPISTPDPTPGTPGGVPYAGAPSAANPTSTPPGSRPQAPSAPHAPTGPVPSQRRPAADGPTFGPRPAADRGPVPNRPDPRTAFANPRPDIGNRLNPDGQNVTPPKPDATPRPDLGNRLDPNDQHTAPKPDVTPRPDLGRRLDPNGQNVTPKPDSTPRPDLGHRLDPNGQNATPKPDSTPRPDIGNRLDPNGDNSRPDSARSHEGDNPRPDIGHRLDPDGQTPKEPYRPATADRPQGSPGGLDDPSDADHRHLQDEIPRHPDGTPVRHPDPEDGDWPAAVNGADPNAPGRNNNCVDVALAMVDTYSGHPTPAASRTPDLDADGHPSDRGERNGRDRIENALGTRFNDMGNGPDAYRRLENTLRNSGHGSQAVIITTDKDGRSHAWNAVNHNGKITYIDGQTGQRSNRPLHNGDNGVFAIPLDPDRAPTTPHRDDTTDPHDTDRRAPEEAAGTSPDTDAVEARKRVVEEQARKANDPNRDWFNRHYRPGDGHRWDAKGVDDETGEPLAIMRDDPDNPGTWTANESTPLPSMTTDRKDGKADTLPKELEKVFDDSVQKRRNAITADQANRAVLDAAKAADDANSTPATKQALADAQEDYAASHTEVRDASEKLGEQAAQLHAVQDHFPGAKRRDNEETGNNRFDQIYDLPDGRMLVVEAKAPSADLGSRKDLAGRQVEQGHPAYFDAIVSQMIKRGTAAEDDGAELDLAMELAVAKADQKVVYVVVKAKVNRIPESSTGGSAEVDGQGSGGAKLRDEYAGYSMEQFNLYNLDAKGNPI